MPSTRHLVLVLALAVSGCRCDGGGTGNALPDFDPEPKAVSFEACPTVDTNGQPVADVFPDVKKVLLRNLGKASGAVQLSFTGPEKDSFSIAPEDVPAMLEATSEVELPIRFSPNKRGDAKADLVIDDGDDRTEPVSVALVGTGSNYPAQPTLEVSLQDKDLPDQYATCFTGGTCLQLFPDTFYKESTQLLVKLSNLGCPALKITSMELLPLGSSSGNLAFFVDEPAVMPTASGPILLTTSDGRASTTLKLRFSPEDDGSGITQRYAYLKLTTNDPANPEFDIQLAGNAAEPSIYAQPTYCDFNDPLNPCGYPTKQASQARFEIKNGGNASITIDSVSFKNPAQTRFTITQNVQGQVIAPGSSLYLLVEHTDAPLYVTELLTVAASAGGMPAGKALISLAGGVRPCMTTEPAMQLNFEDPPTELTTKPVLLKNGAGCGTLIIDNVFVDPSPFFSIAAPTLPAGTQVAGGASATAYVQYKKPVSGGEQAGMLRFSTNDPNWESDKVGLLLYSKSPLDQLPVAVVEGCYPSDPNCTQPESGSIDARLAQLVPRKELIMSGKSSFDPPSATMPLGSQYQFRLVSKPTNASGASLENDGQKTASSTAILSLDSLAVGTYKVTLTVYDDKNQASPPAELKIIVFP